MADGTVFSSSVESLPSAHTSPTSRGIPLSKSKQLTKPRLKETGKETALVEVALLGVDDSYQRRAKTQVIQAFARNFMVEICGLILVSIREDGSLWILDGQTRRAVCETLGIREISAEIMRGLTVAEEARIYLLRAVNVQRPPRDTFRARVTAEIPEAVVLDKILKKLGLITPESAPGVRHGKSEGIIKCIATLEKLVQEEAKVNEEKANYTKGYFLESALRLIITTWGNSERALSQHLIGAVHNLLLHYDEQIKEKIFIEKLSSYDLVILNSEARTIKHASTPQPLLRVALQRKIIELYNYRQQQGRIMVVS